MPLPTIDKPKIKYVKKAMQYCKTYFVFDERGNATQKQEWSNERPKDEV